MTVAATGIRQDSGLSAAVIIGAYLVLVWLAIVLSGQLAAAGLPLLVPLVLLCLLLPLLVVDSLQAFPLFVLIFVFMPLAISLGADWHDSFSLRAVMATRDAMVMLMLAWAFARYTGQAVTVEWLDLLFIGLLVAYALSALPSTAGPAAMAVSVKNAVLMVAFYYIGRFSRYASAPEAVDPAARFTTMCGRVVLPIVLFALGMSLLQEQAWKQFGVVEFMQLKFASADFAEVIKENQLPPTFYTYIGGERWLRNVGPILDGAGFSRFLSFFVVLYFARVLLSLVECSRFPARDIALLVLLVVTQLLTVGRGGLLIDAVGISVVLFHVARLRYAGVLLFLACLVAVLGTSFSGDANTDRHTEGLLNGFKNLSLFGHGLGMGGQQVDTFAAGTAGNVDDVRDSFVGDLAYQTGMAGLVAFALLLLQSLRMALAAPVSGASTMDARALRLAASGCFLGALLTAFLANASISFYALALPMFALGLMRGPNSGAASE